MGCFGCGPWAGRDGAGRGVGGEGGGGSVNGGIFWSNTSHHLATSSEASTSGCHGSPESDLKVSTKSCGQPVCVCVRIRWWLPTGFFKCQSAFTAVTHNLVITSMFLQRLDLNRSSSPARLIYARSLAGQALIHWPLLSLSSMNIPTSKRRN